MILWLHDPESQLNALCLWRPTFTEQTAASLEDVSSLEPHRRTGDVPMPIHTSPWVQNSLPLVVKPIEQSELEWVRYGHMAWRWEPCATTAGCTSQKQDVPEFTWQSPCVLAVLWLSAFVLHGSLFFRPLMNPRISLPSQTLGTGFYCFSDL